MLIIPGNPTNTNRAIGNLVKSGARLASIESRVENRSGMTTRVKAIHRSRLSVGSSLWSLAAAVVVVVVAVVAVVGICRPYLVHTAVKSGGRQRKTRQDKAKQGEAVD